MIKYEDASDGTSMDMNHVIARQRKAIKGGACSGNEEEV